MPRKKTSTFQVVGTNKKADFSLKVHRGEGMALLAMNWKKTRPPEDFVGFAIEYKEPNGKRFYTLKNRLTFDKDVSKASAAKRSRRFATTQSPIQKFRWVHFPRNASLEGQFTYLVTPVFMNQDDELSHGEPQEVSIRLARETHPGKVNVTFTRGFVSSQAFADRYQRGKSVTDLIPKADDGLDFVPSHPKADEALAWMGFEAREEIATLLEDARKDKAEVFVIAYDLSQPEVLKPLEKMRRKVTAIIDDSGSHGKPHSGETQAANRLIKTTGASRVKRQHMKNLQHNKVIIVDGPKVKKVLCGSTNFTWRGFFVQSNNAVFLTGAKAVKAFRKAFDEYWSNAGNFESTPSAGWVDVGISDVDMDVTFSPHDRSNAALASIGKDIDKAKSSVFYSLAFLSQTKGPVRTALERVTKNKRMFVYGMSDKKTKIDLQKPDGNFAPVFSSHLAKNLPEPFKSEVTGGFGTRMHHKFVVLDFDKPSARVYLGSYNFSKSADLKNGENLLLIRDRAIATSYMIEALRMFDHYHFRVVQKEARKARKKLVLRRPPRKRGETPWWLEDYSNPKKAHDRELFS